MDGQAPDGARPHVLVIDDEESMRHAVRRGLERAQFRVTVADTGKGGVDAFLAGRFDAVLTDVRLPDLSGLDIVAVLTEMDARIPVVVMTGYGTMQTALDAMRRGARDYVQKPFSVDEVARVLERAIDEARMSRENKRLRALVERRLSPDAFEAVEAELSERQPSAVRNGNGKVSSAPTSVDAETLLTGKGLPIDEEGDPLPLKEAQRSFEIRYVEDLLARTGGNVAAAARLAGISRPNFHKKLKTLGVDAHRFKQAARRGRTHDL